VKSCQFSSAQYQVRAVQVMTKSDHYRSDHVWLDEVMTLAGRVMSLGQTMSGVVRSCHNRSGFRHFWSYQVRSDQVMSGQIRASQVRYV